jgi:hypothetical protein
MRGPTGNSTTTTVAGTESAAALDEPRAFP